MLAEPNTDNDSIDPRKWVLVFFRHWRLIVGLCAVGALAAVVLGLLLTTGYEATTTILVTKPKYQTALDPQITTAAYVTPNTQKALTSLATSDEVLRKVAASIGTSAGSAPQTAESIRGSLTAEAGSDPSLLLLKARAQDPGQAASLANNWTGALIAQALAIYGNSQDMAYFSARLTDADARLVKAESDLAAHQAKSELSTLKAQLAAVQQDQLLGLAEKSRSGRMLDEVAGYREQVAKYAPDARVPVGSNLTVLLLETRALGDGPSPAVQLQLDGSAQGATASTAPTASTTAAMPQVNGSDAASTWKAGDLLKLLDDLSTVLKSKVSAADARVGDAAPKILALQGQVQQAQARTDRLILERDISKEGYQAVARKVEEVQIAAGSENGQFSVFSQAEPVDFHSVRNILIMATLGAMAGAVIAFVVIWWRQDERSLAPRARDTAESWVV